MTLTMEESKQPTLKSVSPLFFFSDIPKPQEKFIERLNNARAERVKQRTVAEEEHEAHLGMFSYRDWQVGGTYIVKCCCNTQQLYEREQRIIILFYSLI